MLTYLFTNPAFFVIWILALLTAITIHEFAHAWAADELGDPTPRLMGRLTLNPLAHLDPLGTLMLLLVRFGWGKPVVFDPYNLRNPKKDSALISLAGPASNIILAVALSVFYRSVFTPLSPFYMFSQLLLPFIFLNISLAIFNLIPIHPLDGGKILVGLLPNKDAAAVDLFLNHYGIILLFFLIVPLGGSSLLLNIISPIINFILSLLIPGTSLI